MPLILQLMLRRDIISNNGKQTIKPRLFGLIGGLCWVLFAPSFAESVVFQAQLENDARTDLFSADSEQAQQYGYLEQQIFRGEAPPARARLETIISQIEASRHRYHEDLIVPLSLVGDALMVEQDYSRALEAYDRARHIARVSHGLFAPQQLPVIYREADAYRKIGDLVNAGQREEYAYEVMRKRFDDYEVELLPATMRLANFYLGTYNYLAARALYNVALNIHAKNGTDLSLEAIKPLQGVARTHRLEKFPPFYVNASDDIRLDGPSPGLRTTDLERQYMAFNNFPAGEKALQKVVHILRQQEPEDLMATIDAITEFADWHLLFGRNNKANILYSDIYARLEAADLDAAGYFAAPQLVYYPQPMNPKRPRGRPSTNAVGHVSVQFNITANGRIRELRTIASEPPKLMDFRVRRSMRQAVFRPKLVDGVAVVVKDHIYTHEFDYFPVGGPDPTSEQTARRPVRDKQSETTAALIEPGETHDNQALENQALEGQELDRQVIDQPEQNSETVSSEEESS